MDSLKFHASIMKEILIDFDSLFSMLVAGIEVGELLKLMYEYLPPPSRVLNA